MWWYSVGNDFLIKDRERSVMQIVFFPSYNMKIVKSSFTE